MVSLHGILIAVSFAVGIDLTAGLYPSIVVSRREPVEALRGLQPAARTKSSLERAARRRLRSSM